MHARQQFIGFYFGHTSLLIPNEFGKVFELGVQRLETLEDLEIQYSQALRKPERQTNNTRYQNTHAQSDSHRILFACLLRFLYPLF